MSTTVDSEVETSTVKSADPPAPKPRPSFRKIAIIAAITAASVVTFSVILFFVIRASSSASSSPSAPSTVPPRPSRNKTKHHAKELVFAQILFRHGARAPDKQLPEETKEKFPRGFGQLTDRGFKNSHLLGKFLKKRYVDSGFLNKKMVPGEMQWKSRYMKRCVATAATVGAAMFQSEGKKYPHVAIKTSSIETLLRGGHRCPRLRKLQDNVCPAMRNIKQTGLSITEAAYECLTNGDVPPIFQNISIDESDFFLNLYENELLEPGVFLDNIELIAEESMKARFFEGGLGPYKRPEVIKLRFGLLVDVLLGNLETAWQEHIENKRMVKFRVYSTQDWLLGGVLDSFGVLDVILKRGPQKEASYNSMIVMELWKRKGKPFVKFFYKPEEVTSEDHKMDDYTKFVPNCVSRRCHLSNFTNCCNEYRTNLEQRKEACE